MTKIFKAAVFICIGCFSLIAAAQNTGKIPESGNSNSCQRPTIRYEIINGIEGTFGYDIYINGVLTVHQPSRPALQGEKGFATKANAEKVARIVIGKIKKGEMPPSLSVEELKKLNLFNTQ
jgi:hypothetical protein